jgi:hypothetical protein
VVLGYFRIERKVTGRFVDVFKQFPRFGVDFRVVFFQGQSAAAVFCHDIRRYRLLAALGL